MPDDFTPTDWITTAEAAELTGYKAKYLRQLINQGRLKARKLSRDWFPNESARSLDNRFGEERG